MIDVIMVSMGGLEIAVMPVTIAPLMHITSNSEAVIGGVILAM
jgi:hypothetical protein